jgi:guanine nucleotide-binding protein subunit alpha
VQPSESLSLCLSPFGQADLALSFFNEVSRIGGLNYIPTETDVLRARAKSRGITETRFKTGQLS